jgi:large subunit ribosomal protein L6
MSIEYTSRVGRKPIAVPAGIDVKITNEAITAKGPKGQHTVAVHPYVTVKLQDGAISVALNDKNDHVITGPKSKLYKSIAGTQRANINNMINGVHTGFERKLTLVGVGYRAQAKGKVVALSLGYSHPTDFAVPEGVTIETPSQTEIIVKGVNKELVGLVAAQIRSMRGPEPYKGKGVRYSDEVVEIKETKKK